MPRFEPSAQPPLDSVAQPCPTKGLVIVTYVYPDETPLGRKEAVATCDGGEHDEKPAANRFEFLVDFSPMEWSDDEEDDEEEDNDEEDAPQNEPQVQAVNEQQEDEEDEEDEQRELTIATTSQRWSPPHEDDEYVAVVQANRTTYVTITLHACLRDRWLGLSEVFTSHRVFARGRDAANDYQDLLVQSLTAASHAVGGPDITTVLPASGFIRDDFNVIASFNQCDLLEEADNVLHSRILKHPSEFNHEHVGAEDVLPELPGKSQGGNITISPPTPNHPYGAILVGIGRCWPDDLDSYAKAVLQPIIPVHAGYGDVAHVDEFVGFAGGPDNWKMVCASPNLALTLLGRLKERRESLEEEQLLPGCLLGQPGNLAQRTALTRELGSGHFILQRRHAFFQQMGAACQTNRTFLIQQLGIQQARVVNVPVLKHALMPNAANFLPANGGVVVPRQHSFRITAEDAAAIFAGMFDDLTLDALLEQSTHVQFWVDEAMTYLELASTHVDPEDGEALQQRAAAIALANGAQVDAPIAANAFVRLPCPANTVDLFDAYLFLLYRQLGIPMRFVHSAKLNRGGGNLHCATNYLPDFAHLSFEHFPNDVNDLGALKEKLTDPETVADLDAVEELKEELEEAVRDAVAEFEEEEENENSE